MNFAKILSRIYQTDPYFGGAIVGVVMTCPYLMLDYLSSLLFNVNTIPIYSATLVISHTGFPWDYFFGIVADLGAGFLIGAGMIAAFERSGYQFLLAKCLGIGIVLWILHVSVIPKLWEPRLLQLLNRPTVYMSLLNHVFWGAGFGLFLRIVRKSGLAE